MRGHSKYCLLKYGKGISTFLTPTERGLHVCVAILTKGIDLLRKLSLCGSPCLLMRHIMP